MYQYAHLMHTSQVSSGLFINTDKVTENDVLSTGGNPVTQAVKLALKGLALNMAAELRPYGVSAVAITPGFLRSKTMLERFGVTEETWRKGAKKDKNFLESESPLFVGRAVAALAGDPAILERSGQLSWTPLRIDEDESSSRIDLRIGRITVAIRPGLIPRFRGHPRNFGVSRAALQY